MGKGASTAAEEAAAPLPQAWAGLDLVSNIQKATTRSFIQVISVSPVHLCYEAMQILLWGDWQVLHLCFSPLQEWRLERSVPSSVGVSMLVLQAVSAIPSQPSTGMK